MNSSSPRLGDTAWKNVGLYRLRQGYPWRCWSLLAALLMLRDGGNRARDNADHTRQRLGIDGQGRHQDDDMAEGTQKKTSLSGLSRHLMTDPRVEGVGLPCGTVAHEFDSDHEALLPNVADVRQSGERREQAGQQSDFRLQLCQRPLGPENFQVRQGHRAPERIAGETMAVEKGFELFVRS